MLALTYNCIYKGSGDERTAVQGQLRKKKMLMRQCLRKKKSSMHRPTTSGEKEVDESWSKAIWAKP
jgi:hypothetical protein